MSGIDHKVLVTLLEETLSGTHEVYLQILTLFLTETPKSIKELKEKNAEKDCHLVTHIAHTLKGNGLAVGAEKFSDLCEEIESLGKKQTIDRVGDLIIEIEKEFGVCQKDLEVEVNRTTSKTA